MGICVEVDGVHVNQIHALLQNVAVPVVVAVLAAEDELDVWIGQFEGWRSVTILGNR